LLDLSALDDAAQRAWLTLLDIASAALGVGFSIGRFTGLPPDDQAEFAYLTDSSALSRKLLLNTCRLFIQPSAAPRRVDSWIYWKSLSSGMSLQPVRHTVTLISSVFRGDEFLAGFLDNCSGLQGYCDCEHLLIRAASPGNEHVRLVEHVRNCPSAVYLNLAVDPGLYAVWNLGARLATGRYLSNANIDDRRSPEHVAHLKLVLDNDPDVDGVSTALRVSKQRNLVWEDSDDCSVMFGDVQDQTYGVEGLFKKAGSSLASRNLLHCMPVWRRSLHVHLGGFDEKRYGPSADWAFWLHAVRHGAKFRFSAKPLGLYLRDQGTYWRRNPDSADFDARIVAEYGDLVVKGPLSMEAAPENELLISVAVSSILDLLRSGACLEGIGQLLNMFSSRVRMEQTARELVTKVTHDFLGGGEWQDWAGRYRYQVGAGRQPVTALLNALVDLVHGIETERLGSRAGSIRRMLEFASIDLYECGGDSRGLMLFALLARRFGEFDLEQALLQGLHDEALHAFWSIMQSVYRFTRPLPEICAGLCSFSSDLASSVPSTRRNVIYFPDFKGNAYLNLLYQPLREAGEDVYGTSDPHKFLGAFPVPGVENILHVHWVNPLTAATGTKTTVVQRTTSFLTGLERQKQQGFQIYWTIHNYLSHESADSAAEIAFRQSLYRLADRVFVHHPLAAGLLDWLPDHDKLHLCEHGSYDIDASSLVSTSEAREELGYGQGDFVLTHIGRVRDYKGLADSLPLLTEMLDSLPRLKLVIAGQICSNDARRWLSNNQHPRLIVHDGFMNDRELIQQMRAADMGFLSYAAILTSGSLFHWLSCGRPVLAPVRGTIPAYLVDGWNGYSYRNMDVLRELLAYCVTLPRHALERLGMNARNTAQQLEWRMWKQ